MSLWFLENENSDARARQILLTFCNWGNENTPYRQQSGKSLHFVVHGSVAQVGSKYEKKKKLEVKNLVVLLF